MAKRKTSKAVCPPQCEQGMFCLGIAFLIVSAMLYLGYGCMEIFGVLGILAILKALYLRNR